MTIGDQPAFPSEKDALMFQRSGMTYRQWLVGQIAAGASSSVWAMNNDHGVDTILNRADAIIARMEGEK